MLRLHVLGAASAVDEFGECNSRLSGSRRGRAPRGRPLKRFGHT